jgi:hypothetical protein
MKRWPFCAVLVPLVWSGVIILGWPSSSRGLWTLLLHAAKIFGCWPANNEARDEECMVVTGWWKDTHGRVKHGRLISTIWRHSSANLFIGLDSLGNFPVGVSQVRFPSLCVGFLACVFFFRVMGCWPIDPTPNLEDRCISLCLGALLGPVLPVATLPPA